MNLDTSSLHPRLEGAIKNAFRWANVKFEYGKGAPSLLVVFLDGSEDIRAVALLLHKMDGEHTAGLLKPSDLGPNNVGKNLSTYLQKGFKQSVFFLVLDQEAFELEELWSRVENSLSKHGIKYSIERSGDRWRLYACAHGVRKLWIGVVVNGLGQQHGIHTIEDHLVELARVEKLVNESPTVDDPKSKWSKISKEIQHEVYKRILHSEHTHRLFEQHISVLKELIKKLE